MPDHCGCNHCGCEDEEEKIPEEKVEDLKKDIEDLGYKVEKTKEGMKVSE